MTTWNAFDPLLPDTGNGRTRQQDVDDVRNNLLALAAQMAAGVAPFMWGRNQTGTDVARPDADVFDDGGAQRIRLTYTWGTAGGATGKVTKIVFEYSADSGANYYPMSSKDGNYVMTYTYTAAGYGTTDTPGATP